MDKLSLEHAKALIYGTGGNGRKLFEIIKNFCCVEGFIDKRAHDIEKKNGWNVYTIDEAAEHCENKDNYVVFITVKNVFAHNEIASQLLENGFHRIIYKSGNVLKENANEVEQAIDRIYEMLVERKEYDVGFEIPYTDTIKTSLRDRLCIEKTNETVKAWCPVELLFNYKESNDYPGLNMPLFFPMVELYKFFLGDKATAEEEAISNFIVYCCEWLNKNEGELTEGQEKSFIESRVAVFQEMQKMVEVDIDFFKRNCPRVTYDEGKFYLTSSGRNRVTFLIAKGFKYIPVEMSNQDYEKWCDLEFVKKIEENITQNRKNSFFAPFPNPYLVDFTFDFVDYQRLFLFPIANRILKSIYKNNRKKKESLTITDFEKVERERKNTGIECALQDDELAKHYFASLGFDMAAQHSTGQKYLLIDSMYQGSNDILESKYDTIFFLEREEDNLKEQDLRNHGYECRDYIFSIMMKRGKVRAAIYNRM